MAVAAVVREWDEVGGWGVLDAPETPGGCWTHWSSVAVEGFRSLAVGQRVELEWEAAEQDGYAYRAVRAWPASADPGEGRGVEPQSAFSSELTLRSHDDPS
ncbi:hypothetical protein WDZ16_16170 [Pseudokineococcus marinus]|uniref:Cold shock domain-containing protein n=1 Tax=Pseudokineococcus marinus TaxID=351215 RepID=A0A849BX53_9ACTN|nr:cold shock domain-containing protein [Pseudokineococcus marinus]NNH22098.1 cold shock domain-containing protein [Pseudokineococcus marinus]